MFTVVNAELDAGVKTGSGEHSAPRLISQPAHT
jgi:hypothetical protein